MVALLCGRVPALIFARICLQVQFYCSVTVLGTFESVGEAIYASELSGLWYDPTLDGEGFNVLVADAGMVVFFYGYDTA